MKQSGTKYIFPAIFTPEDDGGFSISFPDIPGCRTQAESIQEGLYMANDVLGLMLYNRELRGDKMPSPSALESIKTMPGQFVQFIPCDTRFFNTQPIKKTLTVPMNLNIIAEREGINFSATLQEALQKKLQIA